MKILFVNNFFKPFSGVETCMMTQAKLLEEQGHQVEFFATDAKPYLISDYPYANQFSHYAPYSQLSKMQQLLHTGLLKPVYNWEARQKLDGLINLIQPDLVHIHNVHHHLTSSVIQPCIKHGIPFVKTLHGPDWICPAGSLFFKGSEGYCKDELCVKAPRDPHHCLTNRCGSGSLFKSLIMTLQGYAEKVHKLHDQIPRFICPSEAIHDLGIRFGILPEKLVVVNNLLDERYLSIQPVYDNKGYFLYVGRLDRPKGLLYLLEAARRQPQLRFHIAGTGPIEAEMKDFIATHNLQNVAMLGFCAGDNLAAEYKGCIATVLPCNWFENYPTTILETFAYGKPVIGSDIGGIPELVESGVTGYTFPTGDTEALQKMLCLLQDHSDQAKQMGQQARARFERVSNPQHHYSQLMQVYQSVGGPYPHH